MSLNSKTMFISGADRGIGLTIAPRVQHQHCLVAKTAEPSCQARCSRPQELEGNRRPGTADRPITTDAVASAATVEQFKGSISASTMPRRST